MTAEAVIWHDLECGAYRADLPAWLKLADEHRGVVADIGAGSGRVALELAAAGHEVIALELDEELAAELARRATGLPIEVLCADACDFALEHAVELMIVPMQTIHLLANRAAFLRCAHAALAAGGILAVSLLGDGVEPFELELAPDVVEVGDVRYESVPTALRREPGGAIVIERRRSVIEAGAARSALERTRLEPCDAATLQAEAAVAGFAVLPARAVAPTSEHAGTEIVCLAVRA